MLQSFKDTMSDWLLSVDSRKKDYGSLADWKQQRGNERQGRLRRRATSNRFKVTKPIGSRSSITSNSPEQPKPPTSSNAVVPSLWEKIQSVFSTDQRELRDMKSTFANYRLPYTEENETRRRQGLTSSRLARSETFKKRMMEKMYDDRMLEQLRASVDKRKSTHRGDSIAALSNAESDQVVLLQNRLQKLEQQLFNTQKELELTNKKLTFAHEKTRLLESLLDEANVDNEYVKSRRRIANLKATTDNQPQLRSLSPSPKRSHPVNPLFTSSPIRTQNVESPYKHDKELDNFYSKYPSIPKTEFMNQSANGTNDNESLSPVRVDYNKYSSPR
ncbi:HDL336Cp [Eremothecium sinecaudum]|uniref:HDL336Cp n=1 Tax=Eremothecium sinecaudum TaxID=45286 RepID=A0A0X8HS57_9SACH|nr:HDL336Cp [Eremothecium sinecaudum]AMD20408.1 HDL336Cp [Eremothecium sinecaudum]